MLRPTFVPVLRAGAGITVKVVSLIIRSFLRTPICKKRVQKNDAILKVNFVIINKIYHARSRYIS